MMKRIILPLVFAFSTLVPEAHASIFKEKWIDATVDCIAYASKMNCDKAYNAAQAYKRTLNGNSSAKDCSANVLATAAMSHSLSILGGEGSDGTQVVFQKTLSSCKNY